MTNKRWIWIVLDSVGIGAAPDAHRYGTADEMSNTLQHIAQANGGLKIPNLARIGLGCVTDVPGVACDTAVGAYGRMRERSFGKDTTNGHWEFVGVVLDQPLPVYPDGFPEYIMAPFEAYVGKSALCNQPASGTEVIEQFGRQHQQTGQPIVYTSADSVFQIAAHEDVIPVAELYDWCQYVRQLLTGPDGVGRVIARPFVGSPGNYLRTAGRKDFSLTFGDTVLQHIQNAGYTVCGIGKIHDIYGGEGVSETIHTDGNEDGMNRIVEQLESQETGVIYANLVDFDALYGHRNDPLGFAGAVEAFDRRLPEVTKRMRAGDMLCITADHGCDPTVPGTDHTREWVPVLFWTPGMTAGLNLGQRDTFADVGATLAAYFAVPATSIGTNMLPALRRVAPDIV